MQKFLLLILSLFLTVGLGSGATICLERCSPAAGCPGNCEGCTACTIFSGMGGTTACSPPAGVSPSPSTSVGLQTPCNRCGGACVFAVGNRQCASYSNNNCTQCTPVQSGGAFCTKPTPLRRNTEGSVEPISAAAFIRAKHPEWSDSEVLAEEFFLTWRHAMLTADEDRVELETLLFDQNTKQGRKNLAAWNAGKDGVYSRLGRRVLLAVQAYNQAHPDLEEDKDVPAMAYIQAA